MARSPSLHVRRLGVTFVSAPPAPVYALHPRVEGRIRCVVAPPPLPPAVEVARARALEMEQELERLREASGHASEASADPGREQVLADDVGLVL